MPNKVVVSGAPGTGKTTVAALVARRLRWGFLSLDTIKEALADIVGFEGEEGSNRLGDAAASVLFDLAEAFPNVVAEAWWRRERAARALTEFGGWNELFCTCSPDLATHRVRDRLGSGRHPVHRDVMNPAVLSSVTAAVSTATPLRCGSNLQTVDTDVAIDIDSIVSVLAHHTDRAEQRNPVYVVVSGAPGTGKSMLAARLAGELALPLLSKDVIKESLMDSLPVPDVEVSRQLGKAAMAVVYALAHDQPCGAVLESYFHRSRAIEDLRGLPGSLVEVHCHSSRDLALSRYRSRAPSRHSGHFDEVRRDDELWNTEVTEPLAGGWPVVEVDTTRSVDTAVVLAAVEPAENRSTRTFALPTGGFP